MRFIIAAIIALSLQGCMSPTLWVQEVTPTGGSIGYQNYDPQSDNGAKINALIQCPRHKLVWSGLKSSATAPTYYLTNNFVVPLGSTVEWAEYQYECLSSAPTGADNTPETEKEHRKPDPNASRNEALEILRNHHPDFNEIRMDPKYAAWLSKQPPEIRKLADSVDPYEAIRLVDIYKKDMGIKK